MNKPKFKVEELISITKGSYKGELTGKLEVSISTDTRVICSTDAYLALCGAVFDGHNFVENAIDAGAKLVIINEEHKNIAEKIKGNFLIVEDTLEAYLKIAKYHKDRCRARIIGVTGSSGKTTTKEFLYSIFNSKFKTQKSIKNHNNEIGLCQTLLSIEPDTQYCIVEMGMRALGEIDMLASYAEPDIAVITNVGTAHIGILGSRENIAKAKCEITNYLDENGVLVAHDEELIKRTLSYDAKFKKLFYSLDELEILEKKEKTCKIKYDDFIFEIPSSADYDILNAFAAIKCARIENYTNEEIQKGLLKFKNVEFRNEIEKLPCGGIVISDCYNANPDSAELSLRHVCEVYKDKKIVVVFGDMFELGEFEEEYHKKIGQVINELNVNYFISIGKLAKITSKEVTQNTKKSFDTIEAAAEFLPEIIDKDTVLFLKASRGMKFEKILEMIKVK